jgi:hypothetical protein
VEYGKPKTSPDKFEVREVLRVDARHPVHLKGIIVVCRILEQAIGWVEDLMRYQEEPLPIAASEQSHLNQ